MSRSSKNLAIVQRNLMQFVDLITAESARLQGVPFMPTSVVPTYIQSREDFLAQLKQSFRVIQESILTTELPNFLVGINNGSKTQEDLFTYVSGATRRAIMSCFGITSPFSVDYETTLLKNRTSNMVFQSIWLIKVEMIELSAILALHSYIIEKPGLSYGVVYPVPYMPPVESYENLMILCEQSVAEKSLNQ